MLTLRAKPLFGVLSLRVSPDLRERVACASEGVAMDVRSNKYLATANGRRYLAIPESNSSHCCFEASVLDLSDPEMVNGSRTRVNSYSAICECFSMEEAERIAALLNADEKVSA